MIDGLDFNEPAKEPKGPPSPPQEDKGWADFNVGGPKPVKKADIPLPTPVVNPQKQDPFAPISMPVFLI